MPEPRPAYVVHVLPGRARIKIPSARGDHAYCAVLGDALAACTATRAVTISPRTGGVLIFHDGALAKIARFAAEAGLFVLPSLEPALPAMRGQFQGALAALDHGIERATGGAADLGVSIALLFLALAVGQLRRGNVLVPALPLAWNVLVLLGLAAINNGRNAVALGNGGGAED